MGHLRVSDYMIWLVNAIRVCSSVDVTHWTLLVTRVPTPGPCLSQRMML
jgi:hypothetical protein